MRVPAPRRAGRVPPILAAALGLALASGCATGSRLAAGPPGPAAVVRDSATAPGSPGAVPRVFDGRPGNLPRLPAGHSRRHLSSLPRLPGDEGWAAGSPPGAADPLRRTPQGYRWPRSLIAGSAVDFATAGFPAGSVLSDADTSIVLDSLALWRLRAADSLYREPALLRWAAILRADGDGRGADSVLASPDLARSIWGWEALRGRVAVALERGDTLAADTLLANAATRDWPEGDLAARGSEAARMALARGDTARASARSFEVLRRFPGLPPAAAALRMLDTLFAIRGDSMSVAEVRLAAQVDALRGAPRAGAGRLAAILARADSADRGPLEFRIGELPRRARLWSEALASLGAAARRTSDPATLARIRLEIARTHVNAGRTDSALAVYARAADLPAGSSLRETALWERARELQDAGRFPAAERDFAALAALGGRLADEARHLAGLMAFLAGRTDSALARWDGSPLEAARFWRGVVLRGRGDPRGDSLLRAVAAPPGYGFYAVAARDTLGIRGLPLGLEPARWAPGRRVAERVLGLAAAGMFDEALFLAARWGARDPRLPVAGEDTLAVDHLAAAQAAVLAGRPSRAVGFALRAIRESAALPDSLRWSIQPWAYPPAFDSLVVAECDSLGLEPALVFATMRQESVFDPQARSVSNALGLMQLLMPAAQDAAGWGKEPKPTTEAPLLDPVTNLKWGSRYLARLIRRFEGRIPVALSAYNAGPSTIPAFWRELVARGGDALFCEVASNPDAQDYAKRILGYRAAYRELEPRPAR